MADPRMTGRSSITGTMAVVRHAAPIEREMAAERLAGRGRVRPDLTGVDIVTALEGDERIGFAVLRPSASGGPCLSLSVRKGRRSIGGLMLEHLLSWSGARSVRAGGEAARALRRAGFRRLRGGVQHEARSCPAPPGREGRVAVYERA